MDLDDYVVGEEEIEVDYEPFDEEEAPEGHDAHVHADGDLGLDLNQMNLQADGLAENHHGPDAEQAAAAEPTPVPVVKPWEKALDIALNIADPADRKTMVDAAIAMRDAFNKAEGKAKSQTTSKKPPRSVALAPNKFTGQGRGQSFKVWCEGLKNYMDVKGQDGSTAIATAMTFLEGAPLIQAMVLANQQVVWEWNAWVNAMQSALFQVDPTQEARGWIHTCKLSQDSKFATYTEKFLLNVAILDSNGASMADLDQVAHFKRGLQGSMYDRPTDVDELTKGPFTTLTGIVGKCRAAANHSAKSSVVYSATALT
jgi:hypothetical protein